MADSQLGWSEAQWEKVNNAVTEAFGKANVASAFLTCYGPLAGSVETVRNETLKVDDPAKPRKVSLSADVEDTLKLTNLTVQVELSSEQVADEFLSSALLAFRRAADILAQAEDEIVFQGFDETMSSKIIANKASRPPGLAEQGKRPFRRLRDRTGQAVVSAVVEAVSDLEDRLHTGPFACVLGNVLFESVHEPSPSLVLPADRITPMLKGPLLRSGRMPKDKGIVVPLFGAAIDIVVGTPPTVQFLQRTVDAKFLFRVYERFVLRVRDPLSLPVAGFIIAGPPRRPKNPPRRGRKNPSPQTKPATT